VSPSRLMPLRPLLQAACGAPTSATLRSHAGVPHRQPYQAPICQQAGLHQRKSTALVTDCKIDGRRSLAACKKGLLNSKNYVTMGLDQGGCFQGHTFPDSMDMQGTVMAAIVNCTQGCCLSRRHASGHMIAASGRRTNNVHVVPWGQPRSDSPFDCTAVRDL